MKYILPILAITVLLTSCEDFLDRAPLDQLTSDTFFKTLDEADNGVLACYVPLQDNEWNGEGWQITEIPSDNAQAGGVDPEFTPIDNFTVAADNIPVANWWAIRYRLVTLANYTIDKINAIEATDAEKAPLLGEARFLRAVAYFDLVRIYGDVPLVLNPPVYGDDLLFPRTSKDKVYEQIVADLEFAAEHLTLQRTGLNVGRATKGSALAYLAKVSLTTRDYVKARDVAKEVIDLGVYELMDDFADNFELETSDNNIESIFQIQFTGCAAFGTGNSLQAFFAPWGEGITKDRDGWGSQIPTSPSVNNPNTTIVDAFESGDLRKNPTIMTSNAFYPTVNPEDGGYTYPSNGASASAANIKKYVVGSGANICFMSTPMNAHLMRYSDVLLTYAEAIMFINGGQTSDQLALNAFNQVRERAGLEPLEMIDSEIVLHERRVEFAFEGQRWFDLLRSNNLVERMALHGKNMELHHLLFPIPANELAINPNLTQNPGY